MTIAQDPQEKEADSPKLYEFVLQKYGSDHDLVNGVELYNLYRHVKSHPYFLGEESLPGSVTVLGKHFDNQLIQYDLYNQWVVLEYTERSGGINKIIMVPLHTNGFQIDGHSFEKLALDEDGLLFYQVIRTNRITCYIHWKKQLITISDNINYTVEFSDPMRTFFLEYDSKIIPFSNRRNFAAIFPANIGREARQYMRKNRLRFRKTSVKNLTMLLDHISSNL